jgi:PmbA protein
MSMPAPSAALSSQPDAELLQQLVADALAQARAGGATAAEAAASDDSGLAVTVRLGEVETLEFQHDRGLGLTVYIGQRRGSASTADLAPASIRATVAAALAIARHTAEDPAAGLPEAAALASVSSELDRRLDLWHPWAIDPDEAIAIATRCEAAARGHDARIHNSEGATLDSHAGMRVLGNSLGFMGVQRGTRHALSCSVLARDAAGMQRDYWYDAARAAGDLDAPEAIGVEAARRTVRRLGSRRIATCSAPVLFAPEAARSLIGHALGALRGPAQYRRASFLLGSAGEQVFPAWFELDEQPLLPRGLGTAAFDAEGVATRERALVSGGVIGGYLLDSYSARKLGLASTGHAGGLHNARVRANGGSQAELLRQMGRGLLVTELMGQGVNGVTGDYSRGAAGFWVEDGQPVHAVDEVTIAGNLRDIYRELVAVGSDEDRRGALRVGSVLTGAMRIAGE